MRDYLIVSLLIFGMVIFGVLIERLYQNFAQKNKDLGPFRQNNGKCGCCAMKAACEVAQKDTPPKLHAL